MSYITPDGKKVTLGLGTSSSKGFEGLATSSLDPNIVKIEDILTPEIINTYNLVSTEGMSPKNIQRLTWFALNDPKFETELTKDLQDFIRDSATDSIGNATIREAIVSMILDYNHSTKMLDYDATTKTGESVEIKCEQYKGGIKKLAGASAWGTSPSTLVKLKKDNPLLVNAGFSFGRIQYIVEFQFNDSDVGEEIHKYHQSQQQGNNSTPKASYNHWGNAKGDKIKVKLFPNYNEDAFTKPFLKFLKDNQ